MDSLSPESRALYEILMADTEEIYESKFAAYKKNKLDAVKQFVADTRMQVKDLQTTVDSVPGKVEIEVDPVKAALGEDLAAVKSALSSEISALAPATVVLASTPTLSTASMRAPSIPAVAPLDSASASTTSLHGLSSTKDGLTPEARRIYGYLVGGSAAPTSTTTLRVPSSSTTIAPTTPEARCLYNLLVGGSATQAPTTAEVSTVLPSPTEIEDVQDVVDIAAADLAPTAPVTCSAECPSNDAYAVSMIISPATPNSPTTTCGIVPELAAPTISDKAVDMDVPSDAAPTVTIYLPRDPNRSLGSRADPVALPLTLWTAPQSFNVPVEESPAIVAAVFMGAAEDGLFKGGDSLTSLLPTEVAMKDHFATNKVMATSLLSAGRFTEIKQVGVLSLHKEIKRPPWPPPWSICIQFMPKTTILPLLVESISGDRSCSTTIQLEWNSSLTVSTFSLGAQRAQLKPTVFKWSNLVCHDTHSLIASTRVDRRLDLLLARQATCTLWTWCCLHSLHCSPGSNIFATLDWELLILSLETWMLLNCDFASVNFQWSITVQQSPSSNGFLAIHNGEAEVQRHCSYMRVRTGRIHCQNLRGNTHCSELQSGLGFQTTMNIRFFCCAMVQWKNHSTNSLVSLQFWFQYCNTQRGSLYSCENFQWAVAWVLSYHFPLRTLQIRFACDILLEPTIDGEPWFTAMMALVEQFSPCDIPEFGYKWLMLWSTTENKVMILHILYRLSEVIIDWGPKGLTSLKHAMLKRYSVFMDWKIPTGELVSGFRNLPWDPGIQILICFGGFVAQAAAQGVIMVEAPTDCYGHYIDGYLDQVPFSNDYYINLIQVLDIHSYDIIHRFYHDAGKFDESHAPWDPGGLLRDRLGGKPNFKRGGLSATSLHSLLGWLVGRHLGLWPARELVEEGNMKHILRGEQREGFGWEQNGLDGGFGRGLAWRVCLAWVLFSFFLLDPHLPPPMFLSI